LAGLSTTLEHAGAQTRTSFEGYATTAEHERGADYHWICRLCVDDFDDLFHWRIVQAD
jgi:hypothetical protein